MLTISLLRKSILVNVAEFIALGIVVLRSAVLARVLGPVGIGQYAIILSALLLARLACNLGIPISFLYHSQHDPENSKRYLIHAFWAVLFVGVAGAVVLPLLILSKTSYFGSVPLFALIGIGCYVLIASGISLARSALLIQIEARKLGLIRIVSTACGMLLVLILLAFGVLTVSWAIICFVFAEFVAMFLGWVWIRNYLDFSVKFDWKIIRKLSFMGIRLNWVSVMISVNAQINILLLRYLLDNFESVGYFSRGQRIGMMVVTASQAVMPLLFSRWAKFAEDGLIVHVEKVLRFVSTISIIAILGVLLTGKWLVLILYGREFLPAVQPMMILVPGAILYLLSMVLMAFLSSRGHPELTTIALAISTALNAGLCLLLIPGSGITGAAWALTAGNIVLLTLLTLIVKKKYDIRVTNCLFLNKDDVGSIIKNLSYKGAP